MFRTATGIATLKNTLLDVQMLKHLFRNQIAFTVIFYNHLALHD